MSTASYDAGRFEASVREALVVTQRVLGSARKPVLPSAGVDHAYDDKYALVEAQLGVAAAGVVQALQAAGLAPAALAGLAAWAAAGDVVTLRFDAKTACAFAREVKREVEQPTKLTTEFSGGETVMTKVSTTVTDYFWSFDASWSLEAVRGAGRAAGDIVALGARSAARAELRTSAKSAPFAGRALAPVELPLTWLLGTLDCSAPSLPARVRVDRLRDSCHTPRRNAEVDEALRFGGQLAAWAEAIEAFFLQSIVPVIAAATPEAPFDLARLRADGVLVPAVLFEAGADAADAAAVPAAVGAPAAAFVAAAPGASAVVLGPGSLNRLLAEAQAGLRERCEAAAAALPPAASPALLSGAEARLLVAGSYARRIVALAADAVNHIEALLMSQLAAAVGKVLQPADFDAYMRFHARRLFRARFEPRPFCFAVRRSSEHSPEGTLRIDAPAAPGGDAPAEPIFTVSASLAAPAAGAGPGALPDAGPALAMDFALSAETRVRFGGEVFVHAFLAHRFGAEPAALSQRGRIFPPPSAGPRSLSLVASARQFSSYVLLVGRIASPTSFEPTGAIIVKDKDEVAIPLSLAEIPTPKEFKDAIASLSPEQQRFARAFRAMQLESTLFAVLVLHIKPQLELLLRLAPDALTKEVELTQDLMDLFIKHQIPADLLSAAAQGAGGAGADASARLAAVKANVAAVHAMIKKSEDRELERRTREERFERPLADDGRGAGGGGAGMMALGAAAEDLLAPQMAMMRSAMPMPPSASAPRRMMNKSAAMPMAMPMMMAASFSAPAAVADAAPSFERAAAAPPPSPPSSSAAPPQPRSSAEAAPSAGNGATANADADAEVAPTGRDLTQVPAELDWQYEKHDPDSALRATIISAQGPWAKSFTPSLLSKAPSHATLGADEQKAARGAAFDLLDALSRSGALPMAHAALHVVMGATHRFDESLVDTVVQRNVNPIEKSERSLLVMASTLHGRPARELVRPEHVARLAAASPLLFEGGAARAAIAGPR